MAIGAPTHIYYIYVNKNRPCQTVRFWQTSELFCGEEDTKAWPEKVNTWQEVGVSLTVIKRDKKECISFLFITKSIIQFEFAMIHSRFYCFFFNDNFLFDFKYIS